MPKRSKQVDCLDFFGGQSKVPLLCSSLSIGQNHTEDEFQDIINEVDFDHKGTISLNDFLNLMSRKMNEYCRKEEIRETFYAFDKGNTGFIVAAELKVA